LNGTGGTLSNNTNQYEYTFEVPATGSLQVNSFDIYTNSNVGLLTRPAYIYADTGSGPATTPLASTTITIGSAPGFYTAAFATPVAVNGKFYVGYDNSNDGVISNLNTGATGIGHYRNAVTGSWNQSGLVQRPSWRVSCVGGGAVTPSISNVGLPTLNSSYDVTLSGALPSALAVMVTGLSDTVHNGLPLPASLPGAPGCSVYVAPNLTEMFATDAAGSASASFSIPASTAYVGISLFHQWAVLDPINALGLVVSEAAKATIDA
jgi:hypothetical protein